MTEPITDADREDLTAYLDGEADPATRGRVEARLNRDPALRAEADALKRAWQMLDELPRAEPTPAFTSRTLDQVSVLRATTATIPRPISGPRRVPWRLAACVAGGLVAGWMGAGLVGRLARPSPLRLDDPLLVQDLRLIENLPLYSAVDTLDYVQALDHPDRFGADALGP